LSAGCRWKAALYLAQPTPARAFCLAGHSPDLESNKYALVLAEQDQGIYGEGEHFVHRGDIVFDCGADYGSFTRSALRAGAAVVIAVEPAPYKEECLRRTFATEIQQGRVVVVQKGVWNKEDTLTLYGDSLVQHRTANGPVVPLTTIDKLAADLRLARVDFIKMDIEGAEKQALEGGRQTIKKFKPRLAICHRTPARRRSKNSRSHPGTRP
jgi:FkbM family methyltransferase